MRPYATLELETVQTLTASLRRSVNRDGGWGASAGRQSTTEATALSALALRAVPTEDTGADLARAFEWLIARQGRDGGWPVSDTVPGSSWMSSLAVLSLARWAGLERAARAAVRGGLWLLRQRGLGTHWLLKVLYRLDLAPRAKAVVELNRDLLGWPWTAGSFSWVEPTAYAITALKILRPHLPRTPSSFGMVFRASGARPTCLTSTISCAS